MSKFTESKIAVEAVKVVEEYGGAYFRRTFHCDWTEQTGGRDQ